jgi:MerR family transcriptional regulator, redox-sensitive transcriptional activator SoxR
MTIGELSKRSGLRTSAIRYYESIGLIPAPVRRSGRRDYATSGADHLRVVQCARACGFTVAQTRQLLRAFEAPESARWRTLAESKIRELETRIAEAREMTRVLKRMRNCSCGTVVECGRRLRRAR